MEDKYIDTELAELHRNPLAAYSTLQLQAELNRRRQNHMTLRCKVKLQLFRKHMKMLYR